MRTKTTFPRLIELGYLVLDKEESDEDILYYAVKGMGLIIVTYGGDEEYTSSVCRYNDDENSGFFISEYATYDPDWEIEVEYFERVNLGPEI